MNGAQYLCKLLEKKKVKNIFGLFGDIQTDFAHAIKDSSIKWIGVHNEKSGGFMADIYARTSGKPGIVFTTLGPGATNLTSALANATQDRSALIAISDQVNLSELKSGTHQYVDFSHTFHHKSGITKYASVVKNLKDLSLIIDKAFSIATTEPKGSVHISIPADLFGQKVKKNYPSSTKNKKGEKTLKSTISPEKLIKLLSSEKIGIVIAGGSIERMVAEKEFIKFIEKYNLPVITTFRGKNAIPSNHPQCLGTISRHLMNALDKVIQSVDYIITIGYDYNEGVKPTLWEKRKKTVYNIDCYDNRIKEIFYPPSLFGDLKNILKKLTKNSTSKPIIKFDTLRIKNVLKETIINALNVRNNELHPKRIIDAVNKLYSDNSVIICDVGLNKYYSGLLLNATSNNKIFFSNGMSSMAFTSGAMGAKIASPNLNIIALVGDGGFLMNPQEVITSVAYNQPIIWIVFNNGGLGLIEQAQRTKNGKAHGVHFTKVSFGKMAEAFGAIGKKVGPKDNLYRILKEVRQKRKPAIIDVLVEYTSPHE